MGVQQKRWPCMLQILCRAGRNPLVYTLIALAIGLLALATYIFFGGPRLPPETGEIIERVSQRDLSHVISGQTGYAEGSGVRIWYEDRRPRGKEVGVVLLNFGIAGDGLFWPPEFMSALGEDGFRVIRYDQRGTGASDWMERWQREEAYTLEDMAADALAVLDECRVEQAHLVGLSMGGFIAQEVAIKAPERVASLTLMSTAADPTDEALPQLKVWAMLRSALRAVPILRYRLLGGESNLVRERLAKLIAYVGPDAVDMEAFVELVLYDLRERRGINMKAFRQHQAAVAITRSRYPHLKELAIPALVIHGTEDLIFPFEHAQKLVELLPETGLLALEGVGHVFPYPDMATVTAEVVSHLRDVHALPRL